VHALCYVTQLQWHVTVFEVLWSSSLRIAWRCASSRTFHVFLFLPHKKILKHFSHGFQQKVRPALFNICLSSESAVADPVITPRFCLASMFRSSHPFMIARSCAAATARTSSSFTAPFSGKGIAGYAWSWCLRRWTSSTALFTIVKTTGFPKRFSVKLRSPPSKRWIILRYSMPRDAFFCRKLQQ